MKMEKKRREHRVPIEWVPTDPGTASAMWTARRIGEWFGTVSLPEGDEVVIAERVVYGDVSEFPRN